MDETGHGPVKHLVPSELGTKEYWDKSYQNDIENGVGQDEDADLAKLESWFDDCDAPQKVLEYLTSEHFPLSPKQITPHEAGLVNVLDLGCGNGSSLFELKLEGAYVGPLVGVDYSQQSVDLARQLWQKHVEQSGNRGTSLDNISFHQFDLLKEIPADQMWWPDAGFDLVLDKGTFDAISLSSEMTQLAGKEVRVMEAYPGKVAHMVKPGRYLLVTSCNWTEDEVIWWFTESPDVKGVLKVFGRVKYPVYEFGGRHGQESRACASKSVSREFFSSRMLLDPVNESLKYIVLI